MKTNNHHCEATQRLLVSTGVAVFETHHQSNIQYRNGLRDSSMGTKYYSIGESTATGQRRQLVVPPTKILYFVYSNPGLTRANQELSKFDPTTTETATATRTKNNSK